MIYPVILAGGKGTRLWPLSNDGLPKQFIKFLEGRSLFQKTVDRVNDRGVFKSPYILAKKSHKAIVFEQLQSVGQEEAKLIFEPMPRGTSPSITIAALEIYKNDPKAIILAMNSDNIIENTQEFLRVVEVGQTVAKRDNKLLLFGSKPNYPETGYGYFKSGKIINHVNDEISVYENENFIEKPDLPQVNEYIKLGYQWNCGMFMMPLELYLNEMKKYAPDILKNCQDTLSLSKQFKRSKYICLELDKDKFQKCREDSIDYALIEKTSESAVINTNIGWYDVGSWKTFFKVMPKDYDGNNISGNVLSIGNKNSQIISQNSDGVLSVIGVDNLTIVQSGNATLVMPTSRSQEVKKLLEAAKKQKLTKHLSSNERYFGWGKVEIIKNAKNYKIKVVELKPGKKYVANGGAHFKNLSITQGQGEYINSVGEFRDVNAGHSINVEPGEKFSIKNNGTCTLKFIKTEIKLVSDVSTNSDNFIAV